MRYSFEGDYFWEEICFFVIFDALSQLRIKEGDDGGRSISQERNAYDGCSHCRATRKLVFLFKYGTVFFRSLKPENVLLGHVYD